MRRAAVLPLVTAAVFSVLSGCGQPSADPATTTADAPGGDTGPRAETAVAGLDVPSLQDQVATQLRDQVGGRWTVTCPPGQPAEPSAVFTCAVRDRAGLSAVITVTLGDAGAFSWRVADSPAATPLVAQPAKASH